MKKKDLKDRYRVDSNGCWVWTGGTNGHYGVMRDPTADNRTNVAHRVVYKLLVGPIPPGLVLHHTCHNKLCVNPSHLAPVTNQENMQRWSQEEMPAGWRAMMSRKGTNSLEEFKRAHNISDWKEFTESGGFGLKKNAEHRKKVRSKNRPKD